jgi:hypothetical protein
MTFVDADGEQGAIDADLTLRYVGRYRDEMVAFAMEALEENERDPSPPTSLLQRFAVQLYTEFPLVEIELVSDRRED